MTSPTDAALREAVEAEAAGAIELLRALVRAPSLLGHEEPAQALMEAAYADLGADVRSIPIGDEVRDHAASSPFSWSVEGKRNVVGTLAGVPGAVSGRSLCFNGHVDVVPPGPLAAWTSSPFEPRRDGDWLYGRGAGDMKCGLVAVVQTMRAIRRLGLRPSADVILQSVVEEECTGNGALACVLAGSTAEGVVVAEPFGRAILTAQVGVLWFTVRLSGRAAHVAEAVDDTSAIEQAIAVIAALRTLEAEWNESPPPPYDAVDHPINLNVGTFHAGDWASSIAAEGELGCRVALFPGETVASARTRVEAAVARIAREPALAATPPTVHYDGFACEGFALTGDEPILAAVRAAAESVTGEPPTTVAGTGTTDARAFVLVGGVPAVCYGPLSENLHAADERVWLPSITESALVYATLVRDWCGVAESGR